MKKLKKEVLMLLEKAVQTMDIGVTITDIKGKILYTNEAEAFLHGYDPADLIGKDARVFAPNDFWNPSTPDFKKEMKSWRREAVNLRKDGTTFPVQLISEVIQNNAGEAVGIVTTCEDITERKRVEQELERRALYDTLTGLPNRALFSDRLAQTLRRTRRRTDYSFSVLFLDLDRFKIINDSLGHLAGDQLLAEVARRLLRCLRPGDTVARIGGDEFTILLEDITGPEEATRIAERIQSELALPLNLAGHEVFTTASIGIAISSRDFGRSDDLLRDADIAMYRAKSQGRARYQVFDSTMHAHAVIQLHLENDLRRALERGEFLVFYQPTVCLFTGKLTGFEALMRWQHPIRGLVLPEEFIPLAEETGLIIPMGIWVLQEACRQMQHWIEKFPADHGLTISVNLSGIQLRESDFFEHVKQVVKETGLNPKRLSLEITESSLLGNPELAYNTLRQLKDLGIHLHIDDFGTGYSSLSYLHHLPVDTIKIDRSFISRIGIDQENTEIIGAIAKLAHDLGMEVIAEGVETDIQLSQIKSLQCESAQGFYFSKPMDSNAAESLIQAKASW